MIRYLHNRALWGDEAALALNIMHRSPRELLDPLDFDQAAPVLFLLAEKGVTSALGYSEPAFRALPLVAGLVSLPLFWSIAKRVLEPIGAIIALAFFAVSEPLVFYSAEAKQYGIDVTITLLLLFLLLPVLQDAELRSRRVWLLLVTGTTAVWVSHPSVFVLGSSGLILAGLAIREPQRIKRTSVAAIVAAWSVSFLASYIFVLPNTRTVRDELRLSGATDAVTSAASEHTTVARVVATASWDGFSYPLGAAATATGFVAVMLVVGFWAMLRANPLVALALGAPGMLGVVTALTNRYPWGERFVLFLVPIVILFVAAVSTSFADARGDGCLSSRRRRLPSYSCIRSPSPPAASCRPPRTSAKRSRNLWRCSRHDGSQETRCMCTRSPSTHCVTTQSAATATSSTAGKRAFEAWGALEPIGGESRGDRPALHSRPPQLIVGTGQRPDFDSLTKQLEPLRGRARVWLLFSTTTNQDFLLYLLNGWGRQLALETRSEAAAYLYDLSRRER